MHMYKMSNIAGKKTKPNTSINIYVAVTKRSQSSTKYCIFLRIERVSFDAKVRLYYYGIWYNCYYYFVSFLSLLLPLLLLLLLLLFLLLLLLVFKMVDLGCC